MRVFIKNMVRISLAALAIGILLIVIGINEYNPFRNYGQLFGNRWSFSTSNDIDVNFTDGTKNEADNYQYNSNTSGETEKYNDTKSLDLQIEVGTVILQEGDSFSLAADNIQEDKFTNEYRDGKWKIAYNGDSRFDNNKLNIFGIPISLGSLNYSDEGRPKFIITVPKNFKADECNIHLGTGIFRADNIAAENLDIVVETGSFQANKITAGNVNFNVNVGSLEVRELSVRDNSYYKVDMGNLAIDKIEASNITAECGVGELKIAGQITGENYINNNIGNVELEVEGREKDYNYNVDCNLGNVIINNNKYSGVVNTQFNNKESNPNSFTINCGVGNVTLQIHQ